MIEFGKYDKETTKVKEHGFQVVDDNKVVERIMSMFSNHREINLEGIASRMENGDVFRTKLGDIKQIQNLHTVHNLNTINHSLVRSVFGEVDFEVLNNQLFCKPPNYKMTSAHQDNAYFESDEDIYTFWVPLQDVDVLNSCMFYVPFSHVSGLKEHKSIGTNVRVRTGKKGFSLYSDHYKNKEFVKVPMKYGEILVHDKNTMHFSSPNLSDDYRISFTAIIKLLR